jgi:hypothetical protein
MRLTLATDDGRPHGLGRGSLIIEPASAGLATELRDAIANDPDRVLTIPNARIHMSVDTTGVASVRAGNIIDVRED